MWELNRSPRIAIYPGSFNPFHLGHFDILMQSLEVFDEVYVAVGTNLTKDTSKELHQQRIQRVYKQLKGMSGVWVEGYDTLLTEYFSSLKKMHNAVSHIIRGLRSGTDLEYEINLRKTIHDINPEIEFVYFLPSNPKFYHISSSMIRELAKFDIEKAKRYIHHGEGLTYEDIIS